jgi:invasion protein IalB
MLFAGAIAVVPPVAYAQSGEELMKSEDFGPWKVACTRDAVYNYTFCNTFQAQTLGGADDFVRFGVTRTLGSERVGVNVLNGFAPDSTIAISIDKAHHWQFPATGNIAMLASPSESKKIIDLLLAGKSAQVRFTPAGGAEQQMEVSLERFGEALNRARARAK